MARDKRPLLADLRDELGGLSAELAEMLRCHVELARLEIASDLGNVRRLAVALSIAGVMALTALPLLAVALAWWVKDALGLGFPGWLAVFAAALLATAAAVGYLARRRFRARLCALEETLEELREDVQWLREWMGNP